MFGDWGKLELVFTDELVFAVFDCPVAFEVEFVLFMFEVELDETVELERLPVLLVVFIFVLLIVVVVFATVMLFFVAFVVFWELEVFVEIVEAEVFVVVFVFVAFDVKLVAIVWFADVEVLVLA
jgi:hypothetical protein